MATGLRRASDRCGPRLGSRPGRHALTVEETAHQLGVSTDTVAAWRRHGLLTARRVDGRRSHLYHPGQGRPPLLDKTEAAGRREADGRLSANQLAAQFGVSSSTVTRWHRLGLITAVSVEHHGVLYPAGQPRPTPSQIVAAGRPPACRDQQLITGGQLATRLHVARSTVYRWYRLGLIEAVAADYRGAIDQHEQAPTASGRGRNLVGAGDG